MQILPLTAEEIAARLSKLPEHVADQEYNPLSTHPQSGKAVAEAISALEHAANSEVKDNKVENLNDEVTHEQYPSAKAVRDAIDEAAGAAQNAAINTAIDAIDTATASLATQEYVDAQITDINNKIDNIETNDINELPLKGNASKKTLVINDGSANGDYAVAGGSNNKQLVTDIVGSIADDYVDIAPSEANGDMSVAYGAGNIAHSSASNAFGIKNQGGFLGYYITDISDDKKTLTLSTSQSGASKPTNSILSQWKEGYVVTIINKSLYTACAEIASVNTTNGTVTFKDVLPFDKIEKETIEAPHDRSIVAIPPVGTEEYKIGGIIPTGQMIETYRPAAAGEVELGFSATTFGFDNIAAGTLSTAIGYRNTALGTAAFVTGRENTGSFSALVGGYGNTVVGQSSFAAGRHNTVSGTNSAALGNDNIVSGHGSFASGYHGLNAKNYTSTEGYTTIAAGNNTHAEGSGTTHIYATDDNGNRLYDDATVQKVLTSVTDAVDFWNNNKIQMAFGNSSHVEGKDNLACGLVAHAEGENNLALGRGSHVEGHNNKAEGIYSHAEGEASHAKGKASHAEGVETIAEGEASHAEGSHTTASGNASHAEGSSTIASKYCAHAEGSGTTASGYSAHAEGVYTAAFGAYSHAEGGETVASGACSHAEGRYTTASGIASHTEGTGSYIVRNISGDANVTTYTIDDTSELIVGALIAERRYGSTEADFYFESISAVKIISIDKGNSTITVDKTLSNTDLDMVGFKIYNRGMAQGESSHAEGKETIASGDYTHAEGRYTIASGIGSHAEGANVNNSGTILPNWTLEDGTIIQGNVASGASSHAEGAQTYASGWAAHAEGRKTIASHTGAHAEGNGTAATGAAAHAEGTDTKASKKSAHAEGNGTTASGNYSHAEGLNTIAASTSQHVQGKYNIADTSNKYAHVVGNGTADDARSNAHTLDWQGNAWFAGDISLDGKFKGYVTAGQKKGTESGEKATAEGCETTASGENSHAEGAQTYALGSGAHAEGVYTAAFGDYSHAEGTGTLLRTAICSSDDSTVYKYYSEYNDGSTIPAKAAIPEVNDIVFGEKGKFARVIAKDNTTITLDRTVGEIDSELYGSDLIRGGAIGNFSHTEGLSTIAASNYQHVQGKYNVKDTANQYAHIVGNGNSIVPSNAHTLDWQGNAWFKGDVYVGGASQKYGSKLATEALLENYITKAEFDEFVANVNAALAQIIATQNNHLEN